MDSRIFAVLLLINACLVAGSAIPQDGLNQDLVDLSNYNVLKLLPKDEAQVQRLFRLRDEVGLDLWSEPNRFLTPVLTHLPKGSPVLDKIRGEGIGVDTVADNLQEMIDRQNGGADFANQVMTLAERSAGRSGDLIDLDRYYPYDLLVNNYKVLARNYPSMVNVSRIGRSYEKRDIPLVVIKSNETSNEVSKRAIIFETGMHAREWVGPASGLWIAHHLLTNTEARKVLDNYDFYILPVVNVDGYEYTWSGRSERMWRKTRSRSRKMPGFFSFCKGADPNRNFDSSFGGAGTSNDPCSDMYHGDSAFSEPETAAVRDFTTQIAKQYKSKSVSYFAVHSFSQLWMYPYGYKSSLPSNVEELDSLSKSAVTELEKLHGTKYKCGPISTTVYPAAGSSTDWAYDSLRIEHAFAIELRDTGHFGFLLPADQIAPTSEELFTGIKTVLNTLASK